MHRNQNDFIIKPNAATSKGKYFFRIYDFKHMKYMFIILWNALQKFAQGNRAESKEWARLHPNIQIYRSYEQIFILY